MLHPTSNDTLLEFPHYCVDRQCVDDHWKRHYIISKKEAHLTQPWEFFLNKSTCNWFTLKRLSYPGYAHSILPVLTVNNESKWKDTYEHMCSGDHLVKYHKRMSNLYFSIKQVTWRWKLKKDGFKHTTLTGANCCITTVFGSNIQVLVKSNFIDVR